MLFIAKYKSVLLSSFYILASLLVCANFCNAGSIMTVGQDEGYSGKVMDKIISKWSPPTQLVGEYKIKAVVTVDGRGVFQDCSILKSSGLDALDVSACAAAKAASPYGSPPYGMPATLYFTFWSGNKNPKPREELSAEEAKYANIRVGQAALSTDKMALEKAKSEKAKIEAMEKASKEAKKASPGAVADIEEQKRRYISTIGWDLRKGMVIPKEVPPGVYHAVARIKCDDNGLITESSLIRKTGVPILDRYVLLGIKRVGSVLPPKEGYGNTFDVTFTFTRNDEVNEKK